MLPISFEIYPPKNDDQRAQLGRTLEKLKAYQPQFISCTYGAGGSTREHTAETVQLLGSEHGLEGVPHLTCIGSTRQEIIQLLTHYQQQGVRRIVALRGDMPSGMLDPGELRHANDLVTLIRESFGQHFHIEVAAYPETHPQARDALADIKNFKRKVDAGADAPSPSTFTTPMPISASSMMRAPVAWKCRWCRASCRFPTSASCNAFPKAAAQKSRAGWHSGCVH